MKVALGVQGKRQGWLTVDVAGDPDIMLDISKNALSDLQTAVPIDQVEAFHIMEHLPNFIAVMRNLHKKCSNGAVIQIRVPYKDDGFGDPTHCRYFDETTFKRFTKEFWKEYGIKCWYIEDEWFTILNQVVEFKVYGKELSVELLVDK